MVVYILRGDVRRPVRTVNIAMGFEAGGHRGNFLTEDMSRQIGTFALVPQVADAVSVPVIAAVPPCPGPGYVFVNGFWQLRPGWHDGYRSGPLAHFDARRDHFRR